LRAELRGALLALLLAVIPSARGAEPEVELEVSGGAADLTVGAPITVTLEVRSDPGLPVRFPAPGGRLGRLVILEDPPPESDAGSAGALHRKRWVVAAFEPGTLEIPALQVTVGEGDDAVSLSSEAREIEVRSVLEEGDEDLADIKPPAFLPGTLRWLPWALGAGALLLAAVLLLWWWRRRRARADPGAAAAAVPPLPPDEEALRALDHLLARRHLEEGRVKEFHVGLAEIAKRYLWRRFAVPTAERTTFEVLRDARAVPLDGWVTDRAASILNACDVVKFARHRPPSGPSRGLAGEVRDLVERTRPAPPPAGDATVEG
jgi:hypothetical protein